MSFTCRILLICDDDLLGHEVRAALGEKIDVAMIPATGKSKVFTLSYQEMVLHGVWEMPVRGAQFDLAIVSLVGGTVAGMLRTNPLSPETIPSALYLVDPEMPSEEAWAPRRGCRDVILHRPIEAHALRARVIDLLRAVVMQRNPPEESRILAFLGACKKSQSRRFDPIRTTMDGHRAYPELTRFFGVDCSPEPFLEDLWEKGLLSRKIIDRGRRCGACASPHLQFSEVCPACKSADYARVQVIHHFSCGHIDASTRFSHGEELICPKCNKTLRQIGRDYERPMECLHCAGCGILSPDPAIQVICRSCQRLSTPDKTVESLSYSYEMTALADEAVTAGSLTVQTLESVFNRRSGVCTKTLLTFELDRELARNKRYQSNAALLLVRIDGLPLLRTQDPGHFTDHLERCCAAITRHVRDLDLLSIWGEDTLAIVLPETLEAGAQTVAERIRMGISAISPAQSSLRALISIAMTDPGYGSSRDMVDACIQLWGNSAEGETVELPYGGGVPAGVRSRSNSAEGETVELPLAAGPLPEAVSGSDSQMPVVVLDDDTQTMSGPGSAPR